MLGSEGVGGYIEAEDFGGVATSETGVFHLVAIVNQEGVGNIFP